MTDDQPVRSDPSAPTAGGSRRKAVLVLVSAAVLVLLADQATKQWALLTLENQPPVRLLGGAVYLTLTRNSGAAFSLGSDHTWVFPLINAVVVGWICWMAAQLRSVPWGVSLGLVLGGALGNVTDRIFRAPGTFVGHVVDMVSLFDPYGQIWPIFNLADSSLMTGVGLALLLELTGRQRDGQRIRSGAPAVDARTGVGTDTNTEQRDRA